MPPPNSKRYKKGFEGDEGNRKGKLPFHDQLCKYGLNAVVPASEWANIALQYHRHHLIIISFIYRPFFSWYLIIQVQEDMVNGYLLECAGLCAGYNLAFMFSLIFYSWPFQAHLTGLLPEEFTFPLHLFSSCNHSNQPSFSTFVNET